MTEPDTGLLDILGIDADSALPPPPPGVWDGAVTTAVDPATPEADPSIVPDMDDMPPPDDDDPAAAGDDVAFGDHTAGAPGSGHPDLADDPFDHHDDGSTGHDHGAGMPDHHDDGTHYDSGDHLT